MLRVTIEERPKSVTIRLEGKLIAPWVEEVERCWRRVRNEVGLRTVQVDLSAVEFFDQEGRELLARMQLSGFRLEGARQTSRFVSEGLDRTNKAN
jgi:hypothetical protein